MFVLALKAGGYFATAALAAVGALWARKADVGRMIDQRWASLSSALERRCENAEKAHEVCEAQLAVVRSEVQLLMSGRVAGYQPVINPKAPK